MLVVSTRFKPPKEEVSLTENVGSVTRGASSFSAIRRQSSTISLSLALAPNNDKVVTTRSVNHFSVTESSAEKTCSTQKRPSTIRRLTSLQRL